MTRDDERRCGMKSIMLQDPTTISLKFPVGRMRSYMFFYGERDVDPESPNDGHGQKVTSQRLFTRDLKAKM